MAGGRRRAEEKANDVGGDSVCDVYDDFKISLGKKKSVCRLWISLLWQDGTGAMPHRAKVEYFFGEIFGRNPDVDIL